MRYKLTINVPGEVEDLAIPPDGREIKDAERAVEVADEQRAKIAPHAPPAMMWKQAELKCANARVDVENARRRAVEAHRAALRARLHSRAGRAEKEAEVARGRLAAARAELERAEREVAELPSKIAQGMASASYMREALIQRDALALSIPHLETEAAEAEDRADVEADRAQALLVSEVARAARDLQAAADELRPVLDDLADLDRRLALVVGQHGMGTRWRACPSDATYLPTVAPEIK